MLSGATFRASAIAGAAVFKIVVSSDSMKKATATSQGKSRLLDVSIVVAGSGFRMAATTVCRKYTEVSMRHVPAIAHVEYQLRSVRRCAAERRLGLVVAPYRDALNFLRVADHPL